MEEVFEDISPWHHLIFCEELLNNDGENDVFCWLCEKSVLGCPAYKCLECNFLQHKSCIESLDSPTTEIKLESHGNFWRREKHHLIFVEEMDNGGKEEVVCPGCQKPAFGPAYKCSFYPKCTFFLHKSCTELSHVIHHPVHPKHILILRKPLSSTTCNVCGQNCRRSFLYRCFLCNFDIDIICASRWRLINADDRHQHTFVSIFTQQIQFTCQACGEKEEPNNIACLCTICGLLIHGMCNRYPRTIETRTHDHSLTLTYSLRQVKKQENIFCKLCCKKINTEYAAYYCPQEECGYIAHLSCAESVVRDSSATTEWVAINSVGYESHLVHLVEGINLTEDQRAEGPQEIEHFSHPQHNLILSNEKLKENERCEACMQFVISVPFYHCAQCNFFLHYRCTKLPATIKRGRFHEHSLTLHSQQYLDAERGFFYCRECGRARHGFYYQCDECTWYMLDIQCCLIPEIIEHEGHQHSLYLAIDSSETCNGCGQEDVNFRCTDCNDFALCLRCATLPFVAKYEYDTHLLKLSSKREDDFGEYYCLICEEERDSPDHWFYYCVKCKFTAHSRCVLEKNPCINYGITSIKKDHKHSYTFVQKSKHSPSCDGCGESFLDRAVEYTRCKFIVHGDCLPLFSGKLLKNNLLH